MNLPPDRLQRMVAAAGAKGASDVSLEPRDDGSVLVMARIDGVRVAIGAIPPAEAPAALAKLKTMAELPAYITAEVQEGRIDGTPYGIAGELRMAILPTVRGQRLALRLPSMGAVPPPENLGLIPVITTRLRQLFRRPQGLIVVTGPTGSGKTTTLHSFLTDLARERPDRQIITIEDPVERRLPDITQVEVDPRHNLGFAEVISACLRHDPDVIVVGEVRDPVTAAACVRAALTGHLVATTVHAGRAGEVVPRLLEMGVDPAQLMPALAGVLSQRLSRLIHVACGGAGCAGCTDGFRGRRPVADLLIADGPVRSALMAGRMPPLVADMDMQAAALVNARLTNDQEVQRVIGEGLG